MASDIQDEFSKLLNSICTLSVEESRAAIDQLLTRGLIDLISLKRSERSVALKLLQAIMHSCRNLYDEQEELNDFLSPSLCGLASLLNENISKISIGEHFNGNENSAVELVQENIEILECFLNLFSQLMSNGRINVDHINCVPGFVVEVLLTVFKDCRAKNEISGLSSSMVDQYVIVYRKCSELYTMYAKFVTENLVIDRKYEDKIEFLINVLERMLDVGEVIAVMDLKTISQHWKGYVKLSKLYSSCVRDRLNMSRPIGQLVNNIMDIMNHISSMVLKQKNDLDMTSFIQNLKIGSFFLKIIIVLCEYYVDYLGDCATIVRLIFGIYKCTYDCEENRNDDNIEVINNVRSHLTVAVAPLINQLTSDRAFIQGYVGALQKDFCNSLGNDHKVAVLVSLMTLLQTLEHVPTDTQLLWINSEPSILQTVFHLIHSCEKELLKPSLCTFDNNTELINEMTLYDTLLIRFSRFIISVKTPEFFEQFEDIMLRHVLQPQPLLALFVSDVWCIVARFGSARLCLTHYNYLSNLFLSWPKKCTLSIERVYLLCLVDRLFSLLTEKQKSSLNNSQLSLHLEQLSRVTVEKIIRDNNMHHKIEQINASLRKPEEENKLKIYDMLMESLNMKGFIESSEYLSMLLEVLQRIDQCIILQRYESNQAFNHWFSRLFLDTTSAFSRLLHLMSFDQFYTVISLFIKTVSCPGKLGAVKFLESLSKNMDMIDIRKLIGMVANLFRLLLLDENPIIHLQSIEIFCTFAYNANYTDIVPLTYSGNRLNIIVGNYISRKPRSIIIQITFDKYFNFLYNGQVTHKCARNIEQCKRKVEQGNELVKKVKLNESDVSVLNTNFNDIMDCITRCYEQCEYEKKEEMIKTVTNLLEQLKIPVRIKSS